MYTVRRILKKSTSGWIKDESTPTLFFGDVLVATAHPLCNAYVFAPQNEVIGTPDRTFVTDLTGWNAKAVSSNKKYGDCFVQFDAPFVTGSAVGFTDAHYSTDPRSLPHAFYFYVLNGAHYYCAYEYGVKVTAPVIRTVDTDTFRIDRKGLDIRYFVNQTLIHTSTAFSRGALVVGACLYGNNDGVG